MVCICNRLTVLNHHGRKYKIHSWELSPEFFIKLEIYICKMGNKKDLMHPDLFLILDLKAVSDNTSDLHTKRIELLLISQQCHRMWCFPLFQAPDSFCYWLISHDPICYLSGFENDLFRIILTYSFWCPKIGYNCTLLKVSLPYKQWNIR